MLANANPNAPRPDIPDALWRGVGHARVTLALLMALALTLLLGLILPQQPAALSGVSAERWLTTTAAAVGGMGATLRTLGAFNVWNGAWLHLLLAALGYHLLVRTVDHALALRRAWLPATALRPLPPDLSPHPISLAGAIAPTLERLDAALRPRYRSLAVETIAGQAALYAERGRTGLIGALLLNGGVLLVLGGLLLNDAIGWQAGEIVLTTGGSAKLTPAPGWQVALNTVTGDEGALQAAVTLVNSANGGRALGVADRRPAHWGNLWVSLRAVGPALEAAAQDTSGAKLLLQSLAPGGEISSTIHVTFRQTQTEQGFAAPARNLTLRAVSYPALPEKGISGPVILVEAYRGDETSPFSSALVENEATLAVADATFRLRRDRYVILDALYLPGLLPWLLGGLLALVGAVLTIGWPRRELWVELAERGEKSEAKFYLATAVAGAAELVRLQRALAPADPVAETVP